MDGRILGGLPVSPGRCAGRVRLIRDESDLTGVHTSDILVCAFAPAHWLSRVGRAAAIIVETDGALSAVATIARNLGLPIVMLEGAHLRLCADQWVQVDGSTGEIRLARAS